MEQSMHFYVFIWKASEFSQTTITFLKWLCICLKYLIDTFQPCCRNVPIPSDSAGCWDYIKLFINKPVVQTEFQALELLYEILNLRYGQLTKGLSHTCSIITNVFKIIIIVQTTTTTTQEWVTNVWHQFCFNIPFTFDSFFVCYNVWG